MSTYSTAESAEATVTTAETAEATAEATTTEATRSITSSEASSEAWEASKSELWVSRFSCLQIASESMNRPIQINMRG